MELATGNWNKSTVLGNYQSGDQLLVELSEVGDTHKKWVKCTAQLKEVIAKNKREGVGERIVLFLELPHLDLSVGDQFIVKSTLEAIRNKGNPGEFDAELYWNAKGYYLQSFASKDAYQFVGKSALPLWKDQLNALHAFFKKCLTKHLSGQEEAIALALVLGDKSLLSRETTSSFTSTGALHVLAVSGLHVGLIMQLLLVVMQQFSAWISKYQAILFVVVLMWIYALLTGLSPSVLRAVFMFSVLAIGQIMGRSRDNLNVLFFTAFCLIFFQPFTLFDIGFQLSFAAMLGIFLFNSRITAIYSPQQFWLKWLWQGTAIGFAAQLMTTPLSLFYFHQFPNYFLLANTGLMLTSGLILGVGIALFACSHIPFLGAFLGKILNVLIYSSLKFLEWVEALPGAVATGFNVPFWWVILVGALLIYLFNFGGFRRYTILSYTCILLLMGVLVVNRHRQMVLNELVIFQHNQPVIVVKLGDRIYCFCEARAAQLPKIQRLIALYVIACPGNPRVFNLKVSNWKILAHNRLVSVKSTPQTIDIRVDGKSIKLLKKEIPSESTDAVCVSMPWLSAPAAIHLSDGAFRKFI